MDTLIYLSIYLVLILGHIVFSQRPTGDQQPPEEEEEKKGPCRHQIFEPKGTFESPGYPQTYENNTDCMFRIFTDLIVDVYFEGFEIEESRDCTYDYLQIIFDVMSPDASPDRYCGSGLDKIAGGHLRGKGPVIMAFRSDGSETMSGFKFSYEFEIHGPDPCDSDPCQNGATCKRMVGYYKCICVDGYVGVHCEESKDECASYPCKHGGHCQDGLNNYTCDCINGFTGNICEIEPDPCESNPCQNGGLCTNRIPDYVCSCPRTFMGDSCEQEVPTLPPPTTTPPLEPETEPPTKEVGATTAADVEDDDKQSEFDGKKRSPSGGSDRGRSGVIAVVIIILFLALILGALVAWYWFEHLRKMKKREGLEKEVTLINMKTQAELGREDKATSRTTSTNVMNSKAAGKQNKYLSELQRMPQDIIMEEVSADGKSHARNRRGGSYSNHMMFSQPDGRDSRMPKRLPLAMQPEEIPYDNSRPFMASMALNHQGPNPMKISPEDAVSLLNYLKTNGGKNCDLPTALSAVQNQKDSVGRSLYPSVQNPKQVRQNAIQSSPRSLNNSDESIDLTPEEAAEVVNDLLHRSPRQGPINPQEAFSAVQNVRNRRYSERRPMIDKEKTVVLHPIEVANIVTSFNDQNAIHKVYHLEEGLTEISAKLLPEVKPAVTYCCS